MYYVMRRKTKGGHSIQTEKGLRFSHHKILSDYDGSIQRDRRICNSHTGSSCSQLATDKMSAVEDYTGSLQRNNKKYPFHRINRSCIMGARSSWHSWCFSATSVSFIHSFYRTYSRYVRRYLHKLQWQDSWEILWDRRTDTSFLSWRRSHCRPCCILRESSNRSDRTEQEWRRMRDRLPSGWYSATSRPTQWIDALWRL